MREVIAKRVRAALAERWDALALEAICGSAHPPEPSTLTYRNGRIIGLRGPEAAPSWPLVRLDQRCT